MSSGKYVLSKLVLIEFDFESCSFTETFSKDVDSELFAEGVTIVDDKAYQLTYKNNLYLPKLDGHQDLAKNPHSK